MLCFVSPGFFFFKQKTAYEMRISDWSSDVCSSDLFEHKATLATVAAYMNGDPSLAAAGFRIINHFTGEDDWGSWCYPPELKPSADESFYAVQFCGCGHAIRSSAFEQVGGYEEEIGRAHV